MPGEFLWLVGSIANAHQRPFDAEFVSRTFPGPHDHAQLHHAVEALGLRLQEARLEGRSLRHVPMPCIAFLRDSAEPGDANHDASSEPRRVALIVSASDTALSYFVAGESAPRHLALDGISEHFEVALMVPVPVAEQDAPDHDGAASKTEKFGFRWFVPELLRHKTIWRDVMVASAMIQVLGLAMPLLVQVIIDKVVVHHTQQTLIVIAAAAAAIVLFGAAMTWVRQFLVLHTGNRIDAVLGERAFAHVLKLPPRWFQDRPTGTVVARLQGIEVIREFVSGAAVSLLLDLPFLVVLVAVMWGYNGTLTAIALGFLLVLVVLSAAVTPAFRARVDRQFLLGARTQAFVTEHVAALATVKTLQMEPQLERRYGDNLAAYLAAGFRTRNLGNGYQVAANTVEQTMTLAILVAGALIVMGNSGFTIGMLVAFQMFASRMAQPMLRLASLWQEFQQASVAVSRLGDLMNAPAEPYAVRVPDTAPDRAEVVFEKVAFRYSEKHATLLQDFDLHLSPGELTVIVGPSGAGKSTLVKLLLGFERPASGRIMVGGRDAATLSADGLRALFGVVPQETVLFSGTVLENLALANPSATFEEITLACRLAEVHDAILALPEGYATRVGEQGVGLSGGQRQRIAIARALLKRPRVLIFDEATSHLDPETAAAFARTVNALRGKVTVMFIAHVLPRGLQVDQVVRMAPARTPAAVSPVPQARGARQAEMAAAEEQSR